MKKRKTPLRKCEGCQERKEKRTLIRVVRTPEGMIEIDASGKKNGRGAYICLQQECLDRAQKRDSLKRALGHAIPPDILETLQDRINHETK